MNHAHDLPPPATPDHAGAEQAIEAAALGYATDAQRRSLSFWWQTHAKDHIGWSSFRRRAALGRWTDRRHEFWAEVSRQVVRERAGKLAGAYLEELDGLAELREQFRQQILRWEVKPRTAEGLVRAFVQIDRRVEERRETLLRHMQELRPESRRSEPVRPPAPPPFTQDERRLILQTLRMQREQHPCEQGIDQSVSEESSKADAFAPDAESTGRG